MEKIIELLNEYEKSSYEKDTNWVYEGDEWEYYEQNNWIIKGNWENEEVLTQYELCSKQFGFIKWLVDNDKIDRDKIIEKSDFMPIVSDKFGDFLQPTEEQELLMLLAIQENPIEFLCSVLK